MASGRGKLANAGIARKTEGRIETRLAGAGAGKKMGKKRITGAQYDYYYTSVNTISKIARRNEEYLTPPGCVRNTNCAGER